MDGEPLMDSERIGDVKCLIGYVMPSGPQAKARELRQ
jgi:hypothetical protein